MAFGPSFFLWNLTLCHHTTSVIHGCALSQGVFFLSFNSSDFYSLRGGMVLIEKLIYTSHTYTCAYMKYHSRSRFFILETAVLLFLLRCSPT